MKPKQYNCVVDTKKHLTKLIRLRNHLLQIEEHPHQLSQLVENTLPTLRLKIQNSLLSTFPQAEPYIKGKPRLQNKAGLL